MNIAGNSLFDLVDTNIEEEDEDEIVLTVQKVLKVLEQAWNNEKLCPEILPNKMPYVDMMLEQLQQMEENIEKLRKDDMRIEIHKMEIERIRYIITSYLRIRIDKIEKFTLDIIEQDNTRNENDKFLSRNELKYAETYLKTIDSYLNKFLDKLPPNVRTDERKKLIQPDLNSYVFVRALKDLNNVYIRDMAENKEDEFILDEGSQQVLPYESVAEFVKNGDLQLL